MGLLTLLFVGGRRVGGYDPDAQAYFNQLIPEPSVTYKNAVNTLVLQLKADGNWSELDRFWIHATEHQQNARISLVNPTSTAITEVNSPTWTAGQGYTGNGTTMYLNTNFNPSTSGVNYTLNSASLFSYSRTNLLQNSVDFGAIVGSNSSRIFPRFGPDRFYAPINENLSFNGNVNTDSRGLFSGVRAGANSTYTYKNGVLGFSRLVSNPATIPAANIFTFCSNNAGIPSAFSSRQIACAGLGSGAINQATFYSAIQTFATTIGFNV
jgi:hypothetical protein